MWESCFHQRFLVKILECDSYWFSIVITKKAALRAFYSSSTDFWLMRWTILDGFFNADRRTENFRDVRKPETLASRDFARRIAGRSLAERQQTRVHLHMWLFLTLLVRQDELWKFVQNCSNLFPSRYRGAGICTLDNCKSLIYFSGLFSSHHFEQGF